MTGLQSFGAIQMATLAATIAIVLTVGLCLFLIGRLRGRTFQRWWVWSVSPAIAFLLFFLAWLIIDLMW